MVWFRAIGSCQGLVKFTASSLDVPIVTIGLK